MEKKLNGILEDLKDIKESMSFMNKSFEEMKSNMAVLLENQKSVQKENELIKFQLEHVKSENKKLRASFEFLEREKIANMAVIAGVPEREHEDLKEVINSIAKATGIKIETTDVLYVERLGKRKGKGPGNGERTFPEEISVKFKDNDLRNRLINAVKKTKINSTGIGYGRSFNIYAREQLTFYARQVFRKCLEFKKLNNWKFLWSKEGRIFMREKEGDNCFLISDLEDLEKLLKK